MSERSLDGDDVCIQPCTLSQPAGEYECSGDAALRQITLTTCYFRGQSLLSLIALFSYENHMVLVLVSFRISYFFKFYF